MFLQKTGLLAAPVQVQQGSKEFPLCVTNIWNKPIKVYRCQNIAEFTETDESSTDTDGPTVATVGVGASMETSYDPVTEVKIGDNFHSPRKHIWMNCCERMWTYSITTTIMA